MLQHQCCMFHRAKSKFVKNKAQVVSYMYLSLALWFCGCVFPRRETIWLWMLTTAQWFLLIVMDRTIFISLLIDLTQERLQQEKQTHILINLICFSDTEFLSLFIYEYSESHPSVPLNYDVSQTNLQVWDTSTHPSNQGKTHYIKLLMSCRSLSLWAWIKSTEDVSPLSRNILLLSINIKLLWRDQIIPSTVRTINVSCQSTVQNTESDYWEILRHFVTSWNKWLIQANTRITPKHWYLFQKHDHY